MVAHGCAEDVAEQHDRPAGPGEGEAEPAALAGAVLGDARVRDRGAGSFDQAKASDAPV